MPLLFANPEDRFSYVVAQIKHCEKANSNTLATTQSQIDTLEQRMNDKPKGTKSCQRICNTVEQRSKTAASKDGNKKYKHQC